MPSRFKSRLLFGCALAFCSLLLIAAVSSTHMWQLFLDSDANGNGKSITNLGGITVTGNASILRIIGGATNQFLTPTNTGSDGQVVTKSGTNTQWAAAGGAGGTGIQTNNGSGTNNIFVDGIFKNTNIINGINNWIATKDSPTNAGTWEHHAAVLSGYGNSIDFAVLAGSHYSALVGGFSNNLTGAYSFIGGGQSNLISGDYSMIAGGWSNRIVSDYSVIGGGEANTIGSASHYSAILSGRKNFIGPNGLDNLIIGGHSNSIDAGSSGFGNIIIGGTSNGNHASFTSAYNIILGGRSNAIDAGAHEVRDSAVLGSRAVASNSHTFVWNDGGTTFGTVNSNTFIVGAANGVAINTNDPSGHSFHVQGAMDATSYTRSNGLQMVTIISTNFVDGQLYTNNYGRTITIQACRAVLTKVVVSGYARMDGWVDGNVVVRASMDTSASDPIAANASLSMGSFSVPMLSTYTFTNVSTGAGNAAAPNGGQIIIH